MTTTGELRTIIQELELVDIGDAASYLGEEIQDFGQELLAVGEDPNAFILNLQNEGDNQQS